MGKNQHQRLLLLKNLQLIRLETCVTTEGVIRIVYDQHIFEEPSKVLCRLWRTLACFRIWMKDTPLVPEVVQLLTRTPALRSLPALIFFLIFLSSSHRPSLLTFYVIFSEVVCSSQRRCPTTGMANDDVLLVSLPTQVLYQLKLFTVDRIFEGL